MNPNNGSGLPLTRTQWLDFSRWGYADSDMMFLTDLRAGQPKITSVTPAPELAG
jgi:hypothetical protein